MENFLVSVLGNPSPSLMTAGFAGFPALSLSQLMASLLPRSAVAADVAATESTQV